MPQLTTKQDTSQQATTQRKPTLASQLAVRNEQIENSQTFDPTKQFVNTTSAPQAQAATDAARSREITNQQNIDGQILGKDKRKRRSVDADPEFASIHTIMLAAMRAQQMNETQQAAPQQKGLEVTGLEVSNFAREVVKEMANRGLPLNLSIMQDALGQALENAPASMRSAEFKAEAEKQFKNEIEKAGAVTAKLRAAITESIVVPVFAAAPDPFDPRHQLVLQERLALAPTLAPDLDAKQLKELVESSYNSVLQQRVAAITAEQDLEKRSEILADFTTTKTIPFFALQQQSAWLFKNKETAEALLKLKQEAIATDLEVTATRLTRGQDGAAFDRTWTQLAAEAELTFSDVFTKDFRNGLDARRIRVWEQSERKTRLENEVELTLRQALADADILDSSYKTRKEALERRFSALGQGDEFALIVQRIEVAFVEKSIATAAKDPLNPDNAFGFTILQGTREQFASAFPHLVGTRIEQAIATERRRAGVNIAFQGLDLADVRQFGDNLSPIIAAQEEQAYLLLPALRGDSLLKYNIKAELEKRLDNDKEIQRQAFIMLRNSEKDAVAYAKEAQPALADAIVERFNTLSEQRTQVTKLVENFEVASRKMTITEREAKLAETKLLLAKQFPDLAQKPELLEETVRIAIESKRREEWRELESGGRGQLSIKERVELFRDGQYSDSIFSFGGGSEESKLLQALEGLSPYGVELFRKELRSNLTTATTPEAVLAGELNSDGADGAYSKIAKALLNADQITAGELLVSNAWQLGKEEVERYISTTTPELRAQVAQRIKQNYHLTMLGQSMEAAAAGDAIAYRRYMLAFESDPVAQQTFALRQAIDGRDASGVVTQMRSLSAADASAEKLRQAIMSGDRERIIASVAEIKPEHLGLMDQIFRGGLGQRLYLALRNDDALPGLARRLGVKAEAPSAQLDNNDFTINSVTQRVEDKFSFSFSRDWRGAAQDTEDPKLRMAAAGEEVALAITNFSEVVGSFELTVLRQSGLRDTEVSKLITILTTVSDRGQMPQFKAAFEKEYGESVENFISSRLYVNSSNTREMFAGGQHEMLRSFALKVTNGEKLSTAERLAVGLVLGGYTKSDLPGITSGISPEDVISSAKELSSMISSYGYKLEAIDLPKLVGALDQAGTRDDRLAAASNLLYELYQFRYSSSLTGQEQLAARHAFRGTADARESVRRLRESAEYHLARVADESSMNWNPLELFNVPGSVVNNFSKADDQLQIDAQKALSSAATLEQKLFISDEERRAFDVYARLGSKENLSPEERQEAIRANELMSAYTTRLASLSKDELAILSVAQSELQGAAGAYYSMRSTAGSVISSAGEVVAVIAVSAVTGGTASFTYVLVMASGTSLVVRGGVNASMLGDDYTQDMFVGDIKHAAIMGVSQGGGVAATNFFKGLASKAVTTAGSKIPVVGQALQTAQKVENAAAAMTAKAAQVQANATAAAGQAAASTAKAVTGSGGGVVSNFITQSAKSGLEWGAIGGTSGAISSVLHNSTSLEFWRQNGLFGGLSQLVTQAGENGVASAIFSAKLGFAAPATIIVTRAVGSIRSSLNNKVSEAFREIDDALTNGQIPAPAPRAAAPKSTPESTQTPASPAQPVQAARSPLPEGQLTPEMLAKLKTGDPRQIVDEVGYGLKPDGTPRMPQPKQPARSEGPAQAVPKSEVDAGGQWSKFDDDFWKMIESSGPGKAQSSVAKDAPKPPSDGGGSAAKSEPIKPKTPDESGRIRGERGENVAFDRSSPGGNVATLEAPNTSAPNIGSGNSQGIAGKSDVGTFNFNRIESAFDRIQKPQPKVDAPAAPSRPVQQNQSFNFDRIEAALREIQTPKPITPSAPSTPRSPTQARMSAIDEAFERLNARMNRLQDKVDDALSAGPKSDASKSASPELSTTQRAGHNTDRIDEAFIQLDDRLNALESRVDSGLSSGSSSTAPSARPEQPRPTPTSPRATDGNPPSLSRADFMRDSGSAPRSPSPSYQTSPTTQNSSSGNMVAVLERPTLKLEVVPEPAAPTIKPINLEQKIGVMAGDDLLLLNPTAKPVTAPTAQPGIKPAIETPVLSPSVQPQPALSPSVSTMAPGMKPTLSEAAASATGAESALQGSISTSDSTSSKIAENPGLQPQPQPAQRPGPVGTKTGNRKEDERRQGYGGVFDDQLPPPAPLSNGGFKAPDFDPVPLGSITLGQQDPSTPQFTTLERIELENKQREKKTKVISQYTRRRRRADGTEYDGDFDIQMPDDSEIDSKGNPLKNGSRVVTGDRIVTVQIGTTVTREE